MVRPACARAARIRSRPWSPPSRKALYTQPTYRARWNPYVLSRSVFPADVVPVSNTNLGPGALAAFLGAKPEITERTVWYHPCWQTETPDILPPPALDLNNPWWKLAEETARECRTLAAGKYAVGLPDLVENLDTLASLRGTDKLLLDLMDRPSWVKQAARNINAAWFEAYDRLYRLSRLEDGSSVFWAFSLWGPGRVAKLQCDISAMLSPAIFAEFVAPALAEQ